MAKKVKYYGVFVKRNAEDELPKEVKELVDMLSGHGEIKGLGKSVTRIQVFDNELEQINCALNIKGALDVKDIVIETIDATDKEDFMKKAEQLKDKYSDKEETTGDSCHKPD